MGATTAAAAQPSNDRELAAYKDMVRDLNANLDAMKSPLQQKYAQYQMQHYDELIALSQHRVNVFRWQERASEVMLWVVVLVVIAGLAFSAIQLFDALRVGRDTNGNIELSAQGIKVTSSVVGVVVLALSIAFVVIFVNQIYSVQVVHISGTK